MGKERLSSQSETEESVSVELVLALPFLSSERRKGAEGDNCLAGPAWSV